MKAMSYADRGIHRRHADGLSSVKTGRRLTPAELAKAAAAMGLPVSSNRHQSETTENRNRRAVAYQDGVAMEAKIRSPGVPKHLRDKRPPPKRKR
jgi:hypothetical protein